MGGKDSIIVDADANIEAAVEGVAQSAFGFAGQKCSACSRAIIDEKIYEVFLEKLKAYGFSILPDKQPEVFRMTLVSDKKKEIRVIHLGSEVRAETQIGHCSAHLQKIFIESKKSWMVSLPEYAEMIGSDVQTGAECRERVTPGER